MVTKTFSGVKVSGIACAMPTNRVMTDSYTEYFGKDAIEQFKTVTGIKSRYLSNGKADSSGFMFCCGK